MRTAENGESIDLLVTVKAYPQASDKYGEAICVAGIRLDGPPSWVRLYPIEFRDLPWEQRFKKYHRIRLIGHRRTDDRPESYFPDSETIDLVEHVSADRGWRRRRELIEGLEIYTMCELQRRQSVDGTSLGMVDLQGVPELEVEERPPEAVALDELKLEKARADLFGFESAGLLQPLEPFPFYVRYRWTCENPGCGGHRQSIIDWELVEAWRKWRLLYGDDEVWAHIERRWIDTMFASDRTTYVFSGNMHRRPGQFLVLGVFYPKIRQ